MERADKTIAQVLKKTGIETNPDGKPYKHREAL